MAKSLNELRKKTKPEVQLAARAKAVDILAEINLAEKRKARGLPDQPKSVK
ncbi:hypothetical protein KL866_14690 [Alteromonas sp. ALT199]|nr:hypothetical protein [Alteromonas sp. ALT199]MBT3136322.1 hypothetical protein [Alteromonas sp. ALT199]